MVLIIGLLIARRIVHSPFGWSLQAIRDNRLRAGAIGLNVDARLGVIYTISAAIRRRRRRVLAQTTGFASLDGLDFHRSADTMLMVVIGGAGWLWAACSAPSPFAAARPASAWTPQYWTFWLGLFLVVLVMVGRPLLQALDLVPGEGHDRRPRDPQPDQALRRPSPPPTTSRWWWRRGRARR